MNIVINGIHYEVEKGTTVLQACRKAGIDIPTLCHDDRLEPSASCRMCVVEIDGTNKLYTSCSTLVWEGMVVHTHSDKVVKARRDILDLLWGNHPYECLSCEKSGKCKLQDYSYEYEVIQSTFDDGEKREIKLDDSNHFYYYDARKCILCGLCVRVCDELQSTHAIGLKDRGFDAIVSTPMDEGLINSKCVSCGNCVSVCPVGALTPKNKKHRYWETKSTKTTCSYCGVGCQMDLITKGDKVVEVQPSKIGPNDGLLCVKGKFAYKFINHPDRIKTPLIKRNGKFEEASWDEAYRHIRQNVNRIKGENGPEAFAGLTSARCTNEENYLFQKLIRAVIGTNNVDHCARL